VHTRGLEGDRMIHDDGLALASTVAAGDEALRRRLVEAGAIRRDFEEG
jgi:hypothetical protein